MKQLYPPGKLHAACHAFFCKKLFSVRYHHQQGVPLIKIILPVLLFLTVHATAATRFVTQGGAGTKSGADWPNASDDLQAMMNASVAGDEVWVAAGTYHPNRPAHDLTTIDSANRTNAFVLQSGVKVYGGFAGTETSIGERVLQYETQTSLSGDFNRDDLIDGGLNFSSNTENALHVVIAVGVEDTAILDGFTIRGGNADSSYTDILTVNEIEILGTHGAGMYTEDALVVFKHLNITENHALFVGGALYNGAGTYCRMEKCKIFMNLSQVGAAMYCSNAEAEISSSNIFGNKALEAAGGVYSEASLTGFINSSISGNLATYAGSGVISLFGLTGFINSVISGNRDAIEEGEGEEEDLAASIVNVGSLMVVANSIVYGNSSGILTIDLPGGGEGGAEGPESFTAITHSLIEASNGSTSDWYVPGATDGGGNIDEDPQFVFAPSYHDAPSTFFDFHVSACSPVIDAGISEQIRDYVPFDADDSTRIQGDSVDMGMYEFHGRFNGQPGGDDFLAEGSDRVYKEVEGSEPVVFQESACRLIATITPSGSSPVIGDVAARAYRQMMVRTDRNGEPYVQRSYDISPSDNIETATATITLYFTQEDFDAYNSHEDVSIITRLPNSPTDSLGIKNLRIFQYHGESTDEFGTPYGYSGKSVTINPDEAKIIWNDSLYRWEVTFDIVGFSGFYAASIGLNVLPVQLVSFTGKPDANKQSSLLQWNVTSQQNTKQYIVERSTDATNYTAITTVAANNLNNTSYSFTDNTAATGNTWYYRLKIVATDGSVSYSQIIFFTFSGNNLPLLAQPNPAKGYTLLQGGSANQIGNEVLLTDINGRIISRTRITAWPQRINTAGISSGMYLLKTANSQPVKLMIQ